MTDVLTEKENFALNFPVLFYTHEGPKKPHLKYAIQKKKFKSLISLKKNYSKGLEAGKKFV